MYNVNRMEIKRGDIVILDLNKGMSEVIGSEQIGLRPAVVIQNNAGNIHSPTIIVALITSKLTKAKLPTHVELKSNEYNKLKKDSVVLGEQIRTVDRERIINVVGYVDEVNMKRIDEAAGISIGIVPTEKEYIKQQLISQATETDHFISMWIMHDCEIKKISLDICKLNMLVKDLKEKYNYTYIIQYDKLLRQSI